MESVEVAMREVTDTLLRSSGAVAPPSVHLFSEHAARPYLGYVSARPFYVGKDAADAVEDLALLPAAAGATHLVVVWEHSDLCTALGLPNDVPNGLVVLDVGLPGHNLRWHPIDFVEVAPPGLDGLRAVVPRWGEPSVHRDVALPDPVAALLARWRRGDTANPERVSESMQRAGFTVAWSLAA